MIFERLAGLAQRRGKRVVIGAVIASIVAGAAGAGVADRLDPYGADDPDTESVIADERLERAGYRETGVVVLIEDAEVESAAGRQRVEALADRVAGDPDVAAVESFASTGAKAFVSADGETTYLAVALEPTDDDLTQEAAERIADSLADEPGVTVGGGALAQAQVNEQVESDLRTAELYAFPLLFLLSLLFFRSLVAAMLPLLVGGLAIVGTFVMLRIASEFGSVSIFALNLVTGLGLGLAIDYSLFIVSRYREEIARTGPGLEAMRRTMATAGRTVLFCSLTVAGALASLLVFPQRFLYSMGLGGSLVALIAAAIALIVLPAILALLGNRVNALSPAFLQRRAEADSRPATSGFWYRLSRVVMRVPGRIAVASAALLIALGIPFLSDRVHLGRRAGAAQGHERAPGRRRPARRVPALSATADHARARRRRPGRRGSGRRPGRARRGRRRRSTRRSRSSAATFAIEAVERLATPERAQPGPGRVDPRRRRTASASPASPPPTSTSSRASSTTCRWCWRSSSGSPSSSSS